MTPTPDGALEEDFRSEDQDLERPVQRARAAYFDRSRDRRLEAAETIRKASEHLKTLKGGTMKGSVDTLLAQIVGSPKDRAVIDEAWTALTKLGHVALRHSTAGSPSIGDPDVAEYLFFLYFSTIRFALKHLA